MPAAVIAIPENDASCLDLLDGAYLKTAPRAFQFRNGTPVITVTLSRSRLLFPRRFKPVLFAVPPIGERFVGVSLFSFRLLRSPLFFKPRGSTRATISAKRSPFAKGGLV